MRYKDKFERLQSLLTQLGDQEQDIVLTEALAFGERLLLGQKQYGKLDLANDKRNWDDEIEQERLDMQAYTAFKRYQQLLNNDKSEQDYNNRLAQDYLISLIDSGWNVEEAICETAVLHNIHNIELTYFQTFKHISNCIFAELDPNKPSNFIVSYTPANRKHIITLKRPLKNISLTCQGRNE